MSAFERRLVPFTSYHPHHRSQVKSISGLDWNLTRASAFPISSLVPLCPTLHTAATVIPCHYESSIILRTKSNILSMVHKALCDVVPSYLSGLMFYHSSPCSLHSSHTDLLTVPQICHVPPYLRALALAVSSSWTALPSDIQKSQTLPSFFLSAEHHLFQDAFLTAPSTTA